MFTHAKTLGYTYGLGVAMRKKLGSSYWKLWSATAISNLGDGISTVAYPWLASAITRSPFLIALAAVASRLPWLIFSLPAGVITDRVDRRNIIVAMDFFRGILTLVVAAFVYTQRDSLPSLNDLTSITDMKTNWTLYIVSISAALLFGFAEVLRDNAAQTFMPSLVEVENLEKANGRMWSAEALTNSFIGPPLGSLLVGIAIFLPFFIDASSFFVAAALIALISGSFRSKPLNEVKEKTNFREDLKEGFSWLWSHTLLRPMAIILGGMNCIGSLVGAVYILFAQEILNTSVFVFAILGTAGAIGGILGGSFGPGISKKIGSGTCLTLVLITSPMFVLIMGSTSSWQVVWVVTAVESFFSVLWSVITVSLRQSIIPTQLLGRVNSVYRFFAWGSIPVGIFLGGALVSCMQNVVSREMALRSTFFVGALLGALLALFAIPRLTTARLEAARS
jgi:MFS family permease